MEGVRERNSSISLISVLINLPVRACNSEAGLLGFVPGSAATCCGLYWFLPQFTPLSYGGNVQCSVVDGWESSGIAIRTAPGSQQGAVCCYDSCLFLSGADATVANLLLGSGGRKKPGGNVYGVVGAESYGLCQPLPGAVTNSGGAVAQALALTEASPCALVWRSHEGWS